MTVWLAPGWISAIIASSLGAAGIGAVVWRRNELRGTTLVAPAVWTVLSLASITTAEVTIGLLRPTSSAVWVEPLRYAAAITSFCPLIALLGAKRPQHRAWQFIVLALWGILILPACENIVWQPGRPLEIHDARSWFVVILIAVGVGNSAATRFWLSALAAGAAQLVLLSNYVPLGHSSLGHSSLGTTGTLVGLALGSCALLTAAAGIPRRSRPSHPLDLVWIDFRDAFGTLWALRVVQRINATAAQHQWPVVLTWFGFQASTGHDSTQWLPNDVEPALRQALENILRRFVSSEWIAKRLGDAVD